VADTTKFLIVFKKAMTKCVIQTAACGREGRERQEEIERYLEEYGG
jgi:hypothetical protein